MSFEDLRHKRWVLSDGVWLDPPTNFYLDRLSEALEKALKANQSVSLNIDHLATSLSKLGIATKDFIKATEALERFLNEA